MLKPILLIVLGLCFSLEGLFPSDEPLCNSSWSNFGPLCKFYSAGRKEKPDAVYDVLKTYVKPDALILDLGSGTGISSRQLCKNGFKNVIGVDRDLLMIKEAEAANTPSCTIKYIRADVSQGLPFPDEEFQVVTASSAFHWFANPSSIKEVRRILKPHGYYFIISVKGRHTSPSTEPIKVQIKKIFAEFGIPPKPNKYSLSSLENLQEGGFKIIADTLIPATTYYTKQEYLNHIQSLSNWNLVKEAQRETLLKKIGNYLDTVLDSQGQLKIQGTVTVIMAQKN
jgi:ubiquinone/menaquinone biosynthesis C-methylase UbiE